MRSTAVVCKKGVHSYSRVNFSECPECSNLRRRIWAQKNRAQVSEIQRAYRAKNGDKVRAAARSRNRTNPEPKRASFCKWYEKNKHVIAEAKSKEYFADPEKYRKRSRAWAAAHKEALVEKRRRHYQANQERLRAERRKKHQQNAAAENRKSRAWRAANPVKVLQAGHLRRVRLKGTQSAGVSAKAWAEICGRYTDEHGRVCCAYCSQVCKPTVDHVVPVSRGGKHEPDNVVPACRRCNASKHASLPHEWQARSKAA